MTIRTVPARPRQLGRRAQLRALHDHILVMQHDPETFQQRLEAARASYPDKLTRDLFEGLLLALVGRTPYYLVEEETP